MQTPAMTDRSQPLELAVYTAQSVAAYPLPQAGQIRIGRAADNDIRIQDPTVSAHHAVLHSCPRPPTIAAHRGCGKRQWD